MFIGVSKRLYSTVSVDIGLLSRATKVEPCSATTKSALVEHVPDAAKRSQLEEKLSSSGRESLEVGLVVATGTLLQQEAAIQALKEELTRAQPTPGPHCRVHGRVEMLAGDAPVHCAAQ